MLVLTLAGCATQPIVFKDVVPPEAAKLRTVQTGHPVVALVLGGGASRGFAHVGVIKALEQQGVKPDIVVGTSAGSFVGALYAGGYDAVALEVIALGMEQAQLRDVTFPDRGFVKGELMQDFINQYLDNRSIENLPRRYAAVATDLQSGAMMVFNRGNTGMAVRASSSIPGIFQPVNIAGREYVDGGVLSPVPVRVARQMKPDIIIAVDVSRKPDSAVEIRDTLDVLAQTLSIMGKESSQVEMREADVVIRPDVSEIGTIDFAARKLAIEMGEKAAQQSLPRILALLREKRQRKTENTNQAKISPQ
ncbi:MAG: patatin-like phospholipase family protein [Gammaproteobacteria bacterium]|nr:patatin-like phospholipase family protein [Gammaproteobacteria bacterium]MBU1733052.1 patatin-like phospholipase family protein [Gammaproteobacteria bacterium]MBU1892100.1 patatin-like phospholipase family protein [Gammaproteobacteria bacterium]